MIVMDEEQILSALQVLEDDPAYITKSEYRANLDKWPEHRISFVDSHLNYLKSHTSISPEHYIANLKLMLKKRS